MTRPMVTIGSSFLIAMLAVSFLSSSLGSTGRYAGFACCFLMLIMLALGAFFLPRGKERALFCAICASALAGCLCWTGWGYRNAGDFSQCAGNAVRIRGMVTDIRESSGGTRLALTLRVEASDLPGGPQGFGAIAYVSGETDVDFYDQVTFRGKCLEMSSTPDFDMASYYRGEGIALVISTYEDVTVERPASRPPGYWPKVWNRELCERADRVFLQPYSSSVRAVLLGDTSAMDDRMYNRFSRAGITHIFAVSGMHVTLVAGALFLLLKRLPLPQWLRAALGCGAAWLFVALTGFGLPAVRAGIMITLTLAGTALGRPADSLNSLFLAGLLIALFSPGAILSGSFQLSMTASLGVILFAGPIAEKLGDAIGFQEGRGRAFTNLLGCSLGANLGMFPVVCRLFKGVSLVFPLSNLAAIPLLPLILIPAALALLLEPLPLLPELFAGVSQAVLWITDKAAGLLTLGRSAYWGLDDPLVGLWLAAGLAILLLSLLLRQKKLAVRTIPVLFVVLASALLLRGALNQDVVEITPVYSFDGLSVAVRQGRKATVAALRDDGQVDREMEEFLRGRNVQTVQNLILYDSEPKELKDTAYLASALKVGRAFFPAEAQFSRYADDLLHPEAGSWPLREGHGYELSRLPGGGLLEVYREGGETLTFLDMGGTRVGITASAALAERFDCEILLYEGENLEKLKQIPLKYVILLSKPELAEGETLPDGVWPAYEKPATLYLSGEGGFRLGG